MTSIKIKTSLMCGIAIAIFVAANSFAADTTSSATSSPTKQIYYYPPNSSTTEPILVTLSQPPLYSVAQQRAALATTPQAAQQPDARLQPLPAPVPVRALPAIAQPNVAQLNSPPVAPQAAPQEINLALAPDGTEIPEGVNLGTRHGFEIGVQEGYYRYREPGVDVTELGYLTGFTGSATAVSSGGYSASAEMRYAFGDLNYRGSGSASDKFNDMWDVRGLVGKDFNFPDFTLEPYTGFGWRNLYDDNRGLTSTGAFGYRRENNLYYLPIGINPRFRGPGNSRFAGKVEYDAVLLGQQNSWLSDGHAGDPDIKNMQKSGGSGIRAEMMYETTYWSVGPYFNYWDIGASNVKFMQDSNPSTCFPHGTPCSPGFQEPRNHTTEIGLQFRMHFL
jgi:hypothetical protein